MLQLVSSVYDLKHFRGLPYPSLPHHTCLELHYNLQEHTATWQVKVVFQF